MQELHKTMPTAYKSIKKVIHTVDDENCPADTWVYRACLHKLSRTMTCKTHKPTSPFYPTLYGIKMTAIANQQAHIQQKQLRGSNNR